MCQDDVCVDAVYVWLQALHYKELEYLQSPLTAAESLVHICNQLRLPDAAQGILNYTMANVPGAAEKISANWYEKLCMYSTSLGLYRKQLDVRPSHAAHPHQPHVPFFRVLSSEWYHCLVTALPQQ